MMQQNVLVMGRGAGVAEGRRVSVYNRARLSARLNKLLAQLTGRNVRLLHLGTVMKERRLLGSHYAGLQSVRLDQIRGSEGRSEDFDRAFRPTSERNRERWMRVALAHLRGIGLPPVDLVQVGDVYFVRDGHHRVSVARAFDQASIDAQVTVWEVAEADPARSAQTEALMGAA